VLLKKGGRRLPYLIISAMQSAFGIEAIIMRNKKIFAISVALCATILIALLFAFLYPTYSVDYTDRAEIVQIMNDQHKLQEYVVEKLKNKIPIDLNDVGRPVGGIYTVEINSSGVIHLYHARTKTNIYLNPRLTSNGSYEWSCRGDKPFNMPINCR